ncbi:RrF2 family transcriptional regulator [Azohydromonas sediminis]|uniref:RrF2 family transcriptional regulator n=1 Tax=Azohydromonas sediminis TaxID=2259674 RepID=UPI000E647A14|nr:Rrf2 family transcriptional regulator [Azohydromonas sediminis]
MRLTQMTDFALRLLMYVARHDDRLVTIAEVAQAHGLSEAHLMKITHQLAQAGYLETVRGKGGGMRLARPPAQIRLGAVVRDVEPDFTLVECFGSGNQCTLSGGCRLAGVIHDALQAFLARLDAHTLADMLPPPTDRVAAPLRRVRAAPETAP